MYEALLDGIKKGDAKSSFNLEAAAENGTVICGDPDDCIKTVQKYADAGVDELLLLCQVGQMPHAAIMDTIKLFGRYVIPYFKNVDKPASQPLATAAL